MNTPTNYVFMTGAANPFPQNSDRRFYVIDIYLAAEFRLAGLLGWTNLFQAGSSLIGTPPSGHPHCRGQAAVPQWARDWRACAPLMVQFAIELTYFPDGVSAGGFDDASEARAQYCDHIENEVAVMYAITHAVMQKVIGAR